MPIANHAKLLTKPNSLLKLMVKLKHVANFYEGNATWGNKQKKLLPDWVDEQIAAGFKVYYKNRDGSKGRLE